MVGGPLASAPVPTVIVEATCPAPRAQVFDYVADYRNTHDWLYGIKEFEPLTEVTRGLGARFDAIAHVGIAIKTRVECDAFVEGELFGTKAVKGFPISTGWRFEEIDAATTRVIGEFTYELAGGLAGRAAARLIEPAIKVAASHTAKSLAAHAASAAK